MAGRQSSSNVTLPATVPARGIQQLLDAGISSAYVAKAYAAAGMHLLLEHHGYEDARDLLTAFFMDLDRHEEHSRHDHAST
jgi:hypothetical protein